MSPPIGTPGTPSRVDINTESREEMSTESKEENHARKTAMQTIKMVKVQD
jgi:hypothetical protein